MGVMKMNAKDEILSSILKKAKSLKKKPVIVLTEGWDERGLKASEFIIKEDIADMILIGDESEIKKQAEKLKIDISSMQIINPKTSELTEELAQELLKLREKKGMTIEKAKKLIQDVNYFGCMLAYAGKADAVVGSLICPTAELMRPALQILRKGFVNEVMVIHDPKRDKIFFGTDASLNIEPTVEQLAEMGINAAKCARMFDIEPNVGYISFSTYGSGGDVPQVQILKQAIKIFREKEPEINVDGEFQFDAAINPDAAKKKCPDSELAGKINTFVFPNLNASNIFTHGMMQFSELELLFPVIEGLNKPVAILGRSTPAELVKNMFVVAAVEAGEE